MNLTYRNPRGVTLPAPVWIHDTDQPLPDDYKPVLTESRLIGDLDRVQLLFKFFPEYIDSFIISQQYTQPHELVMRHIHRLCEFGLLEDSQGSGMSMAYRLTSLGQLEKKYWLFNTQPS